MWLKKELISISISMSISRAISMSISMSISMAMSMAMSISIPQSPILNLNPQSQFPNPKSSNP
jgi:hypothetical protein